VFVHGGCLNGQWRGARTSKKRGAEADFFREGLRAMDETVQCSVVGEIGAYRPVASVRRGWHVLGPDGKMYLAAGPAWRHGNHVYLPVLDGGRSVDPLKFAGGAGTFARTVEEHIRFIRSEFGV
jgi:hypothetical protein